MTIKATDDDIVLALSETVEEIDERMNGATSQQVASRLPINERQTHRRLHKLVKKDRIAVSEHYDPHERVYRLVFSPE